MSVEIYRALAFLLFLFISILVIYKFNGKLWKLEIYLSNRFTWISPIICKIVYWLFIAQFFFQISMFVWMFPNLKDTLGSSFVNFFSFSLLLLSWYISYFLLSYWPSNKWRLDFMTKLVVCIQSVGFLVFIILEACFVTGFNSTSYNSVFLLINFAFSLLLDFRHDEQRIDPVEFCYHFMNYLEKILSLQNPTRIPDERPNSFINIPRSIEIQNKHRNDRTSPHLDVPRLNFAYANMPPLQNTMIPQNNPNTIDQPSQYNLIPLNESMTKPKETSLTPITDAKASLEKILDDVAEKNEPLKYKFCVVIAAYLASHLLYSSIYLYFDIVIK